MAAGGEPRLARVDDPGRATRRGRQVERRMLREGPEQRRGIAERAGRGLVLDQLERLRERPLMLRGGESHQRRTAELVERVDELPAEGLGRRPDPDRVDLPDGDLRER